MVGAMSAALWHNKVQNMETGNIEIFLDEKGDHLLRWGLAAACATLANPGLIMGDRRSILKYYPMIDIKETHVSKRRKKNEKK